MIVSKLCIYPLKSAQGNELAQVQVVPQGFLGDREMMLVSGNGKFITQRQFPQLAKIKVRVLGQSITLQVADNSFPTLNFIVALNGRLIEVDLWRDRFLAIDQGDEVAQWFHQFLNLPEDKSCRLVRQSKAYPRLLESKYVEDKEQPLNFADSSPVLLATTGSLAELNERIMEIHRQQGLEIPMNRFRPNIVVETIEPFIEDRWELIQIGDIQLKMLKPCSRCIMTTIDQENGAKNQLKEPLNTLGTFRQLSEQGVMFGINLIPQNTGTIQTGDRLRVLETR